MSQHSRSFLLFQNLSTMSLIPQSPNLLISPRCDSIRRLIFAFTLVLTCGFLYSQQNNQQRIKTSDSLYYLAKDYYYEGDYNNAKRYHEESFEIRKTILTPPEERLFKSHKRLASVYRKLRVPQKAIVHHHKAIGYSIALWGNENRELQPLYTNLGIVYSRTIEMDSSFFYYKKALDISNKKHGEKSVESAGLIMNMALNYMKFNYYDQAQKYFEVCLSMIESTNKNHEIWNQIYNNYGLVLRKKGDYSKAKDYALKALEVKLKNYPADHPSVAKYHSNLGLIYLKLGMLDEAEKAFSKELEISQANFEFDHPSVGGAFSNLAEINFEKRDFNSAINYLDKAIQVYNNSLGPDHYYSMAIQENKALAMINLGNYQDAIKTLESSLSRRKSIGGVHSTKAGKSFLFLSEAYNGIGDTLKALGIIQECLNSIAYGI